MNDEAVPRGGLTMRKYAALCLALGMARGALYSTLQGEDLEEVKRIRDLTATSRLAEALGCTEADLAIDWNDYLAPDEINRIKGFG